MRGVCRRGRGSSRGGAPPYGALMKPTGSRGLSLHASRRGGSQPDLREILTTQTTPLELEILRLQELTRTRHYVAALAGIDPLLARHPEDRDLLYLAAMNLRYLNRVPDALELLRRLEQHHPRYSRLHQERGHCYVALRDAPRAIEAFRRGVDINQALPDSWHMLHGLYRMTGDQHNAAAAAEHIAVLRSCHCPSSRQAACSLMAS